MTTLTIEVAREQAFQYLTSFATEGVLNDALSIVKANEHYKVDSGVCCCNSQDSFPQDLYNKLERSPGICEGQK